MFKLLPEPEEIANPSPLKRILMAGFAFVLSLGLIVRITPQNPVLIVTMTLSLILLGWLAWKRLSAKHFFYSVSVWGIGVAIVRLLMLSR